MATSGEMIKKEERKTSYLDMAFPESEQDLQVLGLEEKYSLGLLLDSSDDDSEDNSDEEEVTAVDEEEIQDAEETFMVAISDTDSSSSSSLACAAPCCAQATASSNSPVKPKKTGRLPRLKKRLGLSKSLTSLSSALAAKQTEEAAAVVACGCCQAPATTSNTDSVIPPTIAPKKSALRKSSSYGCLEPCCQVIPINTKSKAWKQLPVPRNIPCFHKMVDDELLKQQHPVPLEQKVLQAVGNDYSALFGPPPTTERRRSSRRRSSKGVAFAAVHVREHDLTVGDNPSCSFGAPVSLDWTYEQQPAVPIDFFEYARRSQRRTFRELRLAADEREKLLLHYDIPLAEILKADLDKEKIQRQREYTREVSSLVPTSMQVLVESAIRKVKRSVSSSRV